MRATMREACFYQIGYIVGSNHTKEDTVELFEQLRQTFKISMDDFEEILEQIEVMLNEHVEFIKKFEKERKEKSI
jgi:hypothetical protein